MGIDIKSEKLIPVNAIRDHLPPGISPSEGTIRNWVSKGVRGVVLESVVIGTYRYTSEAAIARFIAATSAAPPRPRPADARRPEPVSA